MTFMTGAINAPVSEPTVGSGAVIQPVRPKWLLIDIFADYVLHRHGKVSALALTRLCELFGVPASTTRVTLSRMRKDGWLHSERDGRLSAYRATDRLSGFIADGGERIFHRDTEPWDGRWDAVFYTIPESDRKRRDHLRSRLEWLGYGQYSPGCWLSPRRRNQAVARALGAEHEFGPAEIDMFEGVAVGPSDNESIARRCWNLDALHTDYLEFNDRRNTQVANLRTRSITDRCAFVERVLLISEYRQFPFRDPDLPTELLPQGWIGREAHATFLELRELLRLPAFRYYDEKSGLAAVP